MTLHKAEHQWIAEQRFRCAPSGDMPFEVTVRIGLPETVAGEGAHRGYARCRIGLEPLATDRWGSGSTPFKQSVCPSTTSGKCSESRCRGRWAALLGRHGLPRRLAESLVRADAEPEPGRASPTCVSRSCQTLDHPPPPKGAYETLDEAEPWIPDLLALLWIFPISHGGLESNTLWLYAPNSAGRRCRPCQSTCV